MRLLLDLRSPEAQCFLLDTLRWEGACLRWEGAACLQTEAPGWSSEGNQGELTTELRSCFAVPQRSRLEEGLETRADTRMAGGKKIARAQAAELEADCLLAEGTAVAAADARSLVPGSS
mmetsp:Transcript_30198/g.68320  ORF Transcript_30198/g.68320 Transcript_30198/m.68320 type:complete len:119 (-) Transcript_30198:330-686(-)